MFTFLILFQSFLTQMREGTTFSFRRYKREYVHGFYDIGSNNLWMGLKNVNFLTIHQNSKFTVIMNI